MNEKDKASNDVKVIIKLIRKHISDNNITIGRLAKKTGLQRESLYKTLSIKGNPFLTTIINILSSINLEIKIQPKESNE